MADQARYRIHVPLQNIEGAKTDRTYTCTRGATFQAPVGEFKELNQGDYSRIDSTDGTTDDSSSDSDSS
jgi:hypothetical protein